MAGEDFAIESVAGPQLLNADWDCSGFESGEPSLDSWLKRSAIKGQTIGAARTYAITVDRSVIGYYALAVGSVSRTEATGSVRRNMPDPIPVMLLARLAIDRRWQGRGLGAALLRDAALRTLQAADIAGIRAMLVHAVSTNAVRFYRHFGFQPTRGNELILMVTLPALARALA